ncbi:Uncharacterized protein OS=Bacillus cereus Rock3-42 GN=bcere0021_34850 PE=4 SV=1 [Gemmataceae bacterium]|nr:Uncharacterized protein OS=Bacillus cereus Rock3-42 GN=bcere0021_34850 PE=4 SV=1 [Gemmataceae bacterium]VTT98946.1 Uncharacterized protein OS=Bacillus cereus Rock3-42 GN=bcere0021_34850 PE=4 SV=1 [Gemmataceae bacterium]
MPNPSQHQTKARNNRLFLASFDSNTYPDWAAVVAFYTAVHLIEQLRAMDGVDSTSHQDRLQYVQANHRTIHYEFHELYNTSKLARYEANAVFHGQISNADIKAILIDQWLAAVETYVTGYIADRTKSVLAKAFPAPKSGQSRKTK